MYGIMGVGNFRRGFFMDNKSLVEKTADQIIEYLSNNNLNVGDKLPNEYNLAEELSVSRSTIREAIRSLTSRNILEVKRGVGTFVSEKKGVSEDPLGFSLVDDTLKLTNDLFEIRYLIEPRMAELASIHASNEDIKSIKKLEKKIEDVVNNPGSEHFELDIKFHAVIAKASNNVAMNHLIPIINQSIWLYNSNSYTNKKIKKEMIISHQKILEAIENRKPQEAFNAMEEHISKVRDSLKIK